MSKLGRTLCAALAAGLSAYALGADGVTMTARRGDAPGEVKLDWTGGLPVFAVYRSPIANHLVQPANQLGTTSGTSWVDAPPPGNLFFYKLVGTCITSTTELCDGEDNDCDTYVDEACGSPCTIDNDCPQIEYCAGSSCAPDLPNGASCTGAAQCNSGNCVDTVCCNNTCTDACEACSLAGNLGSCTNATNGTDPDGECPGVSCAGYYYGFVGDTCFLKANVTAGQAVCDGAGSCQSQSQQCTAQATQGPASSSCHPACQDPTGGTCTGTTPGGCTNVNPGNQSCGSGVCHVTVPQCVGGAPNTCVPNSGAAGPEVCNGLDDNCDNVVDNNSSFADGLEPNNSCGSFRILTAVGSNQTRTENTVTLYPSLDADYYRIPANETDGTCACCDGGFCFDEDYRLTIALTAPPGVGSYSLCVSAVCGDLGSTCVTVSAGTTGSMFVNLDGSCSASDSYSYYVRIAPQGPPGFSCLPYTLSYQFVTGCFGALAP